MSVVDRPSKMLNLCKEILFVLCAIPFAAGGGVCDVAFTTPAAFAYPVGSDNDRTMASPANAACAGSGWTTPSLPVSLPSPATVGAVWTKCFVADQSKGAMSTVPPLSAPAIPSLSSTAGEPSAELMPGWSTSSTGTTTPVYIIANDRQLNSVAADPLDRTLIEPTSDWANFRVASEAPQTSAISAALNGLPSRWVHPGGPAYSASLEDNGNVITSGGATGGLTVTLPSTTLLPSGWTMVLSADTYALSVQTNGGYLVVNGQQQTSYTLPPGVNFQAWVQFDGTNFRVFTPTSALCGGQGRMWDVSCFGAWGDDVHDDTAALNAAESAVCQGMISPMHLQNRLYKVTSDLVWDIGSCPANVQSDGFKIAIDGGADIDGASITSTPVLEFRCSGVKNGCDNLSINGRLTVKGSNNLGYVFRLGKIDLSDHFDNAKINYLAPQNFASGGDAGGAQINSVGSSDIVITGGLLQAGSTGAYVALENVTGSKLNINGGAGGSTLLLLENGTVADNVFSIVRTPNSNTLLSITTTGATNNLFEQLVLGGTINGINATAGSGNVVLAIDPVGPTTPFVSLTGVRLPLQNLVRGRTPSPSDYRRAAPPPSFK